MAESRIFFYESGHLNDEGVALFVDALKLDTVNQIPEQIRRHVEDCAECKTSITGVLTLLEKEDYGDVPATALVGREGEGFKYAMETFDKSRPEIGAIAIGVSQRALDECLKYSRQRVAFGQPIASFQAVQFMMADMAIELEAMRLLVYKAAWAVDRNDLPNVVSSYAKAFSADACMKITTDAVQIFGGYGYMKEYPVEKLMRDAKLLQIYEGTSQIQRVVIARHLLKQ